MKEVSIIMNENQNINVNTEVQGEQAPIDNTQEVQEKMLPQSKVNEVVEGRLKREREKLNKEWQEKFDALQESIKLNAMDEKQKAEYQAQKEREAFEEERKTFYAERDAFNKAQYKLEIQRQLNEAGLPDISDTLVGMEAEQVKAQIDVMKQEFDKKINMQIENRIKSSANTPTVPQEEAKPLTLEDINAMTPTQFKQNKAEIEKVLMEAFKK